MHKNQYTSDYNEGWVDGYREGYGAAIDRYISISRQTPNHKPKRTNGTKD